MARDAYRHATLTLERLRGGLPLSPDFVLGAQKCGTTFLYSSLTLHPDVMEARFKETHFLDWYRARGMRWYKAHFLARGASARSSTVTFDATPSYFSHPDAPDWIGEHFPNARMIILLRHPVERTLSHFKHSTARGYETRPLAEALELEALRLSGENRSATDTGTVSTPSDLQYERFGYVARSRYSESLKRWKPLAATQGILVIRSESLFEDPALVLSELCRWLGLAEHDFSRFGRRYENSSGIDPADTTRRMLARSLEAEIEGYESLFATSSVIALSDVSVPKEQS